MQEIIENIVKHLVHNPNQVIIEMKDDSGFLVIDIRVAQEDMGRVIGHEGSRIKALRLIASAVASNQKKKVKLNLLE